MIELQIKEVGVLIAISRDFICQEQPELKNL